MSDANEAPCRVKPKLPIVSPSVAAPVEGDGGDGDDDDDDVDESSRRTQSITSV